MKELQDRPADRRRGLDPAPTAEQPFVYRGFQMVAEEKLRELRGDELRKMNQNGMLPLVMAHLFSLPHDPRDLRPSRCSRARARSSACRRFRERPPRRKIPQALKL
jgi:hypothetical protein